MGAAERDLLLDAFDSNWIAPLGPHVDAFEKELAEWVGMPHAAALSSGTAALHLALRLLGVSAGDDVIVSTLTFVASANAVNYLGARPVFIDSDSSTWNMDPGLLVEELDARAATGQLPKAVVVVDLYGQCADYDPILAACNRFDVPVIEDAAESLGATYKGAPAGSFGAMGVFSFNGNKIITTTGGGMVVAKDAAAITRMRKWANQSREPAIEYVHAELGYNYRMSNVLAAIGRGQLHVLADRVSQRRAVAARYAEAFADIRGLAMQPEAGWGTHTRWLSVFTVAEPVSPTQIVNDLAELDIEARPVWRPMHTQPVFDDAPRVGGAVSEELYRTGICLPSSSSLAADEQARVIDAVRASVTRQLG